MSAQDGERHALGNYVVRVANVSEFKSLSAEIDLNVKRRPGVEDDSIVIRREVSAST
jgi:hypothetical protein